MNKPAKSQLFSRPIGRRRSGMGRRAAIDEDDQRTPPDRDVSSSGERRGACSSAHMPNHRPPRKPSLRLITLWIVAMMMSCLMRSSAELYAGPSWRQEDGGSALPGAGFDRARRLRLAQRTRRMRRLELHEAPSTTKLQGRGSRVVECGRIILFPVSVVLCLPSCPSSWDRDTSGARALRCGDQAVSRPAIRRSGHTHTRT